MEGKIYFNLKQNQNDFVFIIIKYRNKILKRLYVFYRSKSKITLNIFLSISFDEESVFRNLRLKVAVGLGYFDTLCGEGTVSRSLSDFSADTWCIKFNGDRFL